MTPFAQPAQPRRLTPAPAPQIQTAAIRAAFADCNADLAAGRAGSQPQSTFQAYPLRAQILASAFASATFEGDAAPGEFLGGPTVRNAHTTFGLGPNGQYFYFNSTVENMDAYSVHLCGRPATAASPRAAEHRTERLQLRRMTVRLL